MLGVSQQRLRQAITSSHSQTCRCGGSGDISFPRLESEVRRSFGNLSSDWSPGSVWRRFPHRLLNDG